VRRKAQEAIAVIERLLKIPQGIKLKSEVKIFLSHANEDKVRVLELYNKLKEQGYSPWLDRMDLLPGQPWETEILKALKKSDIFIACLSETLVKRQGHFQNEYSLALRKASEMPAEAIYIIPLKFDECKVPEPLRGFQWLNFWEEGAFEKLVAAIEYRRRLTEGEEGLLIEATISEKSLKKILLLSANPLAAGRRQIDEEMREIKEGLRQAKQREQFAIETATAVRYRDLRRQILDNSPNIVHFSGHGKGIERGVEDATSRKFEFDGEESGDEGIIVEDESGQVKLITTEAIAGLFKLFADSVECVVLDACYSQVQAEAIAQHIPYVVGMRKAIGDRATIEFAIAFYDALGSGRDYEFAYNYACNVIDLAGILESNTPKLLKGKSKSPAPNLEQPQKDKMDGLQLRRTLRRLNSSEFNDLIPILNVPPETIPPPQADLASRVDALWNWAISLTGCGLERLQEALEEITPQ
jgi:hypothetical protein